MHGLKCCRMGLLFWDREKYQISMLTKKCYIFKNPTPLNLEHVIPYIVRFSTTVMIQMSCSASTSEVNSISRFCKIFFSNLKHISSQVWLTPQSRLSKMLRSTSANDATGAKSKSRRDTSVFLSNPDISPKRHHQAQAQAINLEEMKVKTSKSSKASLFLLPYIWKMCSPGMGSDGPCWR